MRYTSVNELEHFQFHDAELTSIRREGPNMIWEAQYINVTTANSQNDHPTDMCVKEASLVFESVDIIRIVFLGYETRDAGGVLMEQVPPRTANADETDAILRASLNPSCCILNRYAQDAPPKNGHAFITTFTLDGDAGIYDLTFVFDRLVVTWDAYDGKAWYEDEKWKKRREN